MIVKNIIKWLYLILLKKKLTSLGKNSIMNYPYRIEGKGEKHIGDNVYIYSNCHLQTISVEGSSPVLRIGNNIRMWYNSQISCAHNVIIENGCTFAANCFITDVTHRYDDVTIPAHSSQLKVLPGVVIGEGSWVGRNVIILGAKVGKHCIIGAGTMVTKDIPDYCVVVGNPCKIIKRFNVNTNKWKKTDKEGNFI